MSASLGAFRLKKGSIALLAEKAPAPAAKVKAMGTAIGATAPRPAPVAALATP